MERAGLKLGEGVNVNVNVEGAATPKWKAQRLLAFVALALVASALFFAPRLGFRWPCPVHTLFGIPCPSCGLTRATRLAAHGDFAGATHMHPLWMVVLPFLMVAVGTELAGYVRGGRWGSAGRVRAIRVAGLATVGLLLVVWIARFLGAFGGPCPDP